jgi:hypothetical protein
VVLLVVGRVVAEPGRWLVLLYFSHIQEMSCSIGFTGGQSTGCPDLVICRPSAVALNRPHAAANSVSLTPTVNLAHETPCTPTHALQ